MVPDRAEAMRRLRVYHTASVDSGSRAMNTAIEDELAKARADLLALQRDHQAQAELLTEETTATTSLRGEVELLAAEIETLRAERDQTRTEAAGLTTERDSAAAEAATLRTRVSELQASQADFDRRVQLEVARVVASTGTAMPAHVTPAGDAPQAAELHAQFAAITDPAAQTAFWRKLTPEQQALILKHQA
jgi:hypothetical protein